MKKKPKQTDHEIITAFRAELRKIMPGYKWSVHKSRRVDYPLEFVVATGIQSSGKNRLSTLEVRRSLKGDEILYEVRSAGFGTRAPWLTDLMKGNTLAQALRSLQNYYEWSAQKWAAAAGRLREGRKVTV